MKAELLFIAICLMAVGYARGAGLDSCWKEASYVNCTEETDYHPSSCECESGKTCYIQMTITSYETLGMDENGEESNITKYKVNNGTIGPTIIINQNQTLVVDVTNNMQHETTSIHWHGMHQTNVPWMDGVSMITQWPILPNGGKFRYILRAHPSGTHWYHSHVGKQRNYGLFGALIVKETSNDTSTKLRESLKTNGVDVVDNPKQFVIAITEHTLKPKGEEKDCDFGFLKLYQFQMNGHKLSRKINVDNPEPSFTISPEKYHRFRVIGAVEETVFRISIDDHKLFVVATDGYLTKPFEVDVLHVHAGERYDFILKPRGTIGATDKNVFPIRIESIEVACEHHEISSHAGYAYLKYESNHTNQFENKKFNETCVALNCPFGEYPREHKQCPNLPYCKCHNVYDALELLVETRDEELATDSKSESLMFFNYDLFIWETSLWADINNISFTLPDTPFTMSAQEPVKGECSYTTTKNCTKCPHTVSVPEQYMSKPIEFVLSSLKPKDEKRNKLVTKLGTHPIHLHGRSFWVKKIVYPEYTDKGTIEKENDDVTVPKCGYGKWTNKRPSITKVNKTSIRKDTIIVPAGGYVVIEFVAHNPGSWFMHCHIDHHLEAGMGMVIKELPECANDPPAPYNSKEATDVCIPVDQWRNNEEYNKCTKPEDETKADEELPVELKNYDVEGFNGANLLDDDESAYSKLKKSLDYDEKQQHPGANIRDGFANSRPWDGERDEWFNFKKK